MKIQSLSYSTLLHQLSFSSSITDNGQYLVISTPKLPHYFWGNFLMFANPPGIGDLERWESLFSKEFNASGCRHSAFTWDSVSGEAGEIEAFEEIGYYFEFDDILKTDKAHLPVNYNDQLVIRPLESDTDWNSRVELNLSCSEVLTRNQVEVLGDHFRTDTIKVGGFFLGGFIDDLLVGEMRLTPGGKGLGLISTVKTHPDFRKTGICRTLLYHGVQMGQELFGLTAFIIVADQAGPAASVYKSVGFEVMEQGASLIRRL